MLIFFKLLVIFDEVFLSILYISYKDKEKIEILGRINEYIS